MKPKSDMIKPPPTVFVGLDMQDDPEYYKPEIVKVLQTIRDSINIQLLPVWLRLLIK